MLSPTIVLLSMLGFAVAPLPAQDRYQNVEDQYNTDQYKTTYGASKPKTTLKLYPLKKQNQGLKKYKDKFQEKEEYNPMPFSYQYAGEDAQGLASSKIENQGEDGVVTGEYRVELPDGRTQIVSYTADEEHGYQAEVRYEGEAHPEVPEPNDYLGPEGQVRVRQYPKHTRQPYGRY